MARAAASTSPSSAPTAPARRRSSAPSVGERPFDAGKLRTGHNVQIGFLSQHAEELEAGGARTVLESAVKRTGLSPNQARALLGRFLFSGEEVDKPLDGLSGGERQRLSLASLVASGSNVLILDEPTNHLDIESREALEDALQSFPGTLLLVTHDRALLDAVGTRTIAVEDHTLHSYTGGWPEYSRVREERIAAGIESAPMPPALGTAGADRLAAGHPATEPEAEAEERPAADRTRPAKSNGDGPAVVSDKAPSKNARKREQQLEKAIERAEAELAKVEDELAAPEAWATKYESAKSTARHTAARRAVEQAYAELEEHVASFTSF